MLSNGLPERQEGKHGETKEREFQEGKNDPPEPHAAEKSGKMRIEDVLGFYR